MAIYNFECESCRKKFETFSSPDINEVICNCGSMAKKVFVPEKVGFIVNGYNSKNSYGLKK